MRSYNIRSLTAALILGVSLNPVLSHAANPEVSPPSDDRLLAVGAGAIVGIVAFNMLTYPFGSVPFVAGALAGTPVDIALGSRILATLTAGAGALAMHYLYPRGQ